MRGPSDEFRALVGTRATQLSTQRALIQADLPEEAPEPLLDMINVQLREAIASGPLPRLCPPRTCWPQ
jgi:hypothetical protein